MDFKKQRRLDILAAINTFDKPQLSTLLSSYAKYVCLLMDKHPKLVMGLSSGFVLTKKNKNNLHSIVSEYAGLVLTKILIGWEIVDAEKFATKQIARAKAKEEKRSAKRLAKKNFYAVNGNFFDGMEYSLINNLFNTLTHQNLAHRKDIPQLVFNDIAEDFNYLISIDFHIQLAAIFGRRLDDINLSSNKGMMLYVNSTPKAQHLQLSLDPSISLKANLEAADNARIPAFFDFMRRNCISGNVETVISHSQIVDQQSYNDTVATNLALVKITEDHQLRKNNNGFLPEKLESDIFNVNYPYYLSLFNRYIKEALTYKDKEVLYKIKHHIIKEAIKLKLAKVISKEQFDNPFFCDFTLDDDCITELEYIFNTIACLVSDEDNQCDAPIIDRFSQFFSQYEIENQVFDNIDKVINFFTDELKLYKTDLTPYYHFPNDFFIRVIAADYYDVYLIDFQGYKFHIPTNKLDFFDVPISKAISLDDRNYGRPLTDHEREKYNLPDILNLLGVIPRFPNNLKTKTECSKLYF